MHGNDLLVWKHKDGTVEAVITATGYAEIKARYEETGESLRGSDLQEGDLLLNIAGGVEYHMESGDAELLKITDVTEEDGEARIHYVEGYATGDERQTSDPMTIFTPGLSERELIPVEKTVDNTDLDRSALASN